MDAISTLGSLLPFQPRLAGANGMATGTASPAATAAQSAATATDPAPAPDSAVAGGLQALAASLQGLRGVADTLRGQLEAMLGDTSGASSVASAVSASIRQRASFQFITQEGDVVQLSIRSRASIASSAATVQDAHGSATASRTTVVTSARLSVQVHGDLNDKELAAIKDVLGQVETLADQFFGGDVQAAFAASGSLHIDSTQLASMAMDLSSRMRVRGAAQSTTATVPDGATAVAASAGNGASAGTSSQAAATAPVAATPVAAATTPTAAVASLGAAAATPAAVQPTVNFPGSAWLQPGNVAAIEMSMKARLQLMLIAVIPAARTNGAAPSGATTTSPTSTSASDSASPAA